MILVCAKRLKKNICAYCMITKQKKGSFDSNRIYRIWLLPFDLDITHINLSTKINHLVESFSNSLHKLGLVK